MRALLATVAADPSAEVIRLPPLTRTAVAQFVESSLPGVPIRRSSTPACGPPRDAVPDARAHGRLREGGIASSADGAPARGADRRADGRPFDSAPARPAARACRPGCAGARDPRAERPAAGRPLAEPRRDRGRDGCRVARDSRDPRPRPPARRSVHPIVRAGFYAELRARSARKGTSAPRACSPRNRVRRNASPSTCWQRAGGGRWVFERLVEAGTRRPGTARPSRRRCSCGGRSPSRRRRRLTGGLAAGARQGRGERRARRLARAPARAVEAAPNAVAAAERPGRWRARSTGTALRGGGRGPRPRGVRARHGRRAARARARGRGGRGRDERPVVSPTVALRRSALRERAVGDPAMPPEAFAVAAFISVLMNEPADVGAGLANRALAGRRDRGRSASTFASDGALAALGGALRPGAAAARRLDRARPRDRRQRPARRRPGGSRLACACDAAI